MLLRSNFEKEDERKRFFLFSVKPKRLGVQYANISICEKGYFSRAQRYGRASGSSALQKKKVKPAFLSFEKFEIVKIFKSKFVLFCAT